MGFAFFVGVAVGVGVGAEVLTDAEGDGVGVVEGTGAGQLSWPLSSSSVQRDSSLLRRFQWNLVVVSLDESGEQLGALWRMRATIEILESRGILTTEWKRGTSLSEVNVAERSSAKFGQLAPPSVVHSRVQVKVWAPGALLEKTPSISSSRTSLPTLLSSNVIVRISPEATRISGVERLESIVGIEFSSSISLMEVALADGIAWDSAQVWPS